MSDVFSDRSRVKLASNAGMDSNPEIFGMDRKVSVLKFYCPGKFRCNQARLIVQGRSILPLQGFLFHFIKETVRDIHVELYD